MGGTNKVKGRRRSKRGSTRGDRKGLTDLPKEPKKSPQEKESRGKSNDKESETQTKYSVRQLLSQATDCMDTFNFELAQKFLQRAIEVEPDNLQVLECSGNLLIEVGELEKAKQCFGRAIALSPDVGHSKYMYMGQLHEGEEAVEFFKIGIELMKKVKEGQEKEPEAACAVNKSTVVTSGEIASAYCSMAEVYLTDSCLAADAEQHCKECLEKAIETDKDSAEAYQIMASYWLSKDNKEQAKKFIEKSISLWLPKMKAIEEEELNSDGPTFDPLNPCPMSYQNRIGTAKILMELEMNDIAEEILEGLLQEDDQVIQVWYMLGLMNVEKKSDESKAPARFFLTMAKKLYLKLRCDDEPVLLHTEELLSILGPGEGLDESWLKNQGEESDSDVTEEDILSSDNEAGDDEEKTMDGKRKGKGETEDEEKMEH